MVISPCRIFWVYHNAVYLLELLCCFRLLQEERLRETENRETEIARHENPRPVERFCVDSPGVGGQHVNR